MLGLKLNHVSKRGPKPQWVKELVSSDPHYQRNNMADSRLAPSQWETSLQSNVISHWLGANLESALNNISSDSQHQRNNVSSDSQHQRKNVSSDSQHQRNSLATHLREPGIVHSSVSNDHLIAEVLGLQVEVTTRNDDITPAARRLDELTHLVSLAHSMSQEIILHLVILSNHLKCEKCMQGSTLYVLNFAEGT